MKFQYIGRYNAEQLRTRQEIVKTLTSFFEEQLISEGLEVVNVPIRRYRHHENNILTYSYLIADPSSVDTDFPLFLIDTPHAAYDELGWDSHPVDIRSIRKYVPLPVEDFQFPLIILPYKFFVYPGSNFDQDSMYNSQIKNQSTFGFFKREESHSRSGYLHAQQPSTVREFSHFFNAYRNYLSNSGQTFPRADTLHKKSFKDFKNLVSLSDIVL